MKFKFTKEDLLALAEDHLVEKGFKTGEVGIVYVEKDEYEYYGDPTRQDRREVKRKYFDGIEAEVTFEANENKI